MGIGDRDRPGGRLRWDERSGELRFEDAPAPRPERLPWLLLAAAVLAVVAAVGWASWRGGGDRSASRPAGDAPVASVPLPGAPMEQAAVSRQSEAWVPDGPVLAGRVVRIVDGDTIDVTLDSGRIRVRMHSIDAPEHDQPGGAASKAALAVLVDGADVELEPVGQESYGRMVAVVYRGDDNINAEMVAAGQAWVAREYARDPRYCEAEMVARAARLAVWALPADQQIAPWEWRAVQRRKRSGYSDYSGETLERCVAAMGKRPGEATLRPLPDAPEKAEPAPAQAPAACAIKGNIGSRGKVYHLPGSAAYARTEIDPGKGERWFCSEAEARAAGWRPVGG